MEVKISESLAALSLSAVIVLMLSALFVAPQQATAVELNSQAISLGMQDIPDNTTMYYAQELKSGVGIIETFESKSDSNTDLYDYWYRFKTSNRSSVYSVRLESIDGRRISIASFDSDGHSAEWHEGYGITGSTEIKTDCEKNAWYYFNVSTYINWWDYNENQAIRYDQFKITVTEHPVIKSVSGVRVVKRAKTSFNVVWSKQSNARKYQVKYRVLGGAWNTLTTSRNSLALVKLKKSASYQIKVRAYCKNGYDLANDKARNWTAWSTTKNIKTQK